MARSFGTGLLPDGPAPAGQEPSACDPSRIPPLTVVAEHIPHGFECRSCGGAAYNWVKKCARYVETGEGCCPDFRQWIAKAKAGEPTVEERHKARLAAQGTAARSAETFGLGPKGNGPVSEADAPLPPSSPSETPEA